MIYDVSKGGDNATIMLADSAQLAFTKEMSHLYLHLYTGEQFENLQDQRGARQNIPYRRETFFDKEILIPFDANFNRLDDDAMRRQYVGKNIAELRHTIDSINHRVDSTGGDYARILLTKEYVGITHNVDSKTDSILPYKSVTMPARDLNIDSIFQCRSAANEIEIVQKAIADVKDRQQEYEFKALSMNDDRVSIRRHEIELVKKFTLSVACLIFFFIGAPLGAIIRKGGIGTPLVISVFLFIFYYIIDNTGYKMPRDGHWEVWQGMWISISFAAERPWNIESMLRSRAGIVTDLYGKIESVLLSTLWVMPTYSLVRRIRA
jgi:lipopolysaccharide export system permease protein